MLEVFGCNNYTSSPKTSEAFPTLSVQMIFWVQVRVPVVRLRFRDDCMVWLWLLSEIYEVFVSSFNDVNDRSPVQMIFWVQVRVPVVRLCFRDDCMVWLWLLSEIYEVLLFLRSVLITCSTRVSVIITTDEMMRNPGFSSFLFRDCILHSTAFVFLILALLLLGNSRERTYDSHSSMIGTDSESQLEGDRSVGLSPLWSRNSLEEGTCSSSTRDQTVMTVFVLHLLRFSFLRHDFINICILTVIHKFRFKQSRWQDFEQQNDQSASLNQQLDA